MEFGRKIRMGSSNSKRIRELRDDIEAITTNTAKDSPTHRQNSNNKDSDIKSDIRRLIEILGCRSNDEIKKIKKDYKELFKEDLEKYLAEITSGDLKELLLALLEANRDEKPYSVDDKQIDKDARKLCDFQKDDKDKESYITIMTKKSFHHLKEVFEKYKDYYEQEDSTKKELQESFQWLVQCIKNKPM
ncbi:annexin A2-A-like [Danio rerio]|uniref:Annexin A2-A-like n=1 Tax=Danio rerio TaxID=7955 RepID=A0AB13AAX5_DANRE|nr:annexin A2-A-like [Danio rerio]|eukprot:XP_001339072.3 annexin A2-A-like [Danio rerio]